MWSCSALAAVVLQAARNRRGESLLLVLETIVVLAAPRRQVVMAVRRLLWLVLLQLKHLWVSHLRNKLIDRVVPLLVSHLVWPPTLEMRVITVATAASIRACQELESLLPQWVLRLHQLVVWLLGFEEFPLSDRLVPLMLLLIVQHMASRALGLPAPLLPQAWARLGGRPNPLLHRMTLI